jgi:hypothetical protein
MPSDLSASGGQALTLVSIQGRFEAWSWINDLPLAGPDDPVPVGRVCTLALGASDASALVLTRFVPSPHEHALRFVSPLACPVAGEVSAVRRLVGSIVHVELRRFVSEALSITTAFHWYWTCPGSLAHHHSYPGGLARHSREVAERAARAVGDRPSQRDFAIAYGLLHDYGKLWSYEDGHLTRIAQRLGHEHLGFEKLMASLHRLRDQWDEGGYVMQSLLSGNWKRDRHAPAVAIGNIVRSLDQFSAEDDRTISRTRTKVRISADRDR